MNAPQSLPPARREPLQLAGVARWATVGIAALWLTLRFWALYEVRRATPDFESRWGTLSLAGLAREAIADSENGARYFESAGRLLKHDDRFSSLRSWLRSEPASVPAAERDAVLDLARQNDLPLRLFRAGAGLPRCQFYSAPPKVEDDLGFVMPLLLLARLDLLLDRESEGSAPPDDGAIRRALALSGCLQRERGLILRRIGQAIERSAIREIHFRVEGSRVGTDLERLASVLPREEAMPSIVETAKFDLLALRSIQQLAGQRDMLLPDASWNPLAVRGFPWAVSVRIYDDAISRIREGEIPARHWPMQPWSRLFGDLPVLWRDLEARREFQSQLRELARFALLVADRGSRGHSFEEAAIEVLAEAPAAGGFLAKVKVESGSNGAVVLSLPAADRPHRESSPGDREPDLDPWEWRLPPAR